MIKKGKYKLLSYFVEKNLIYYKSISKNKKIVAFAMFETKLYEPIISILNGFLRKRFIRYYSIRINTSKKNNKEILLNFVDAKKERIIQFFNVIQKCLLEINTPINFLEKEKLEKRFVALIFKELNSNVRIKRDPNSLLIINDEGSKLLDFYKINLNNIENQNSFINSFISLIAGFNKMGSITFSFKVGYEEEINFTSYFVSVNENMEDSFNIEKAVNEFFNYNALKRHNVKIKGIFNYVWRLGISNDFFMLKFFYNLFLVKNQCSLKDLLLFNSQFEQNLVINQIKFVRINNNLLFIEQYFIFLVLIYFDENLILKIVKKYCSKYYIYILILNNLEYKELLEIDNIKLIKNIKILNPDEINKFDYKEFKNQVKLKYS